MNSTILFFGRLGETLGRQRMVEIPAGGCTIAELKAIIGRGDREAGAALSDGAILAAVDQAIVADDMRVSPGREIAFLSPLSGG